MARRTEEGARLAGEAEDRRKWREGWQKLAERLDREDDERLAAKHREAVERCWSTRG